MTLGDHIYKRLDIAEVLNNPAEPVCKPANYPTTAPGRDHVLLQMPGFGPIVVISLMGRTYMKPVDCPFTAADRVLAGLDGKAKLIFVDVHAEATADKYLLARHLDGRVTAVIGTHTHVPTADEQLLPGGTAFICDVGMTGPYDSILGRKVERVLHTVTTFEPVPFDVATGDVRLAGVVIEADATSGRAISIRRYMLREA
jgi:metallophosphoesterase (TIGR00282 family)